MNTLSAPIIAQKDAAQAGWCEMFDFYLKTVITTPWGAIPFIRLTDLPGGFLFFTPKIAPEVAPYVGVAWQYPYWPIKRALIKGDAKFTADKMQLIASNVTTEFAGFIAAIDWYDTPVIIRKVSTTIASPTADDCVVIWSGLVDAVKIRDKTVTLECSSDLAALQVSAPRENMHTNCRFSWADDQCTRIRFLQANYKTGTVGSSSTVSLVNSSDFSEDAASSSAIGTDQVNALADAAITASSEGASYVNQAVTVVIYSHNNKIHLSNHGLTLNDAITFGGTTVPSPLVAGTTYYIAKVLDTDDFQVSASPNGAPIFLSSTGTAVTISTVQSYAASGVKTGNNGYWKLGTAGDWGTQTNGFWQIPDAQAGLANAALKPYIQFDFGSAKTLKTWLLQSVANLRQEELVRLVALFSSPDASTWKHETYFELPPVGGVSYMLNLPTASSARYWRICIRSRWAEALFFALLGKVSAYTEGVNYWAWGRITFASNTTTAALQSVSRRVLESYNGKIVPMTLPVAPVNGDTFTIERGCPRTFNACCARQNWENFGGFLDLPYQQVIR